MNAGSGENIDAALVRRLIAAQFPEWANLPVRAVRPGGWDNRTFRLGTDLSVRLPSAARYAPQAEAEHRWLPVLAARLPLAIPRSLALGRPGCGFPFPWSVRTWLVGRPLVPGEGAEDARLAAALGAFLRALGEADAAGAPPPGARNFFRGGDLAVYDEEARGAVAALGPRIDGAAALAAWGRARASRHAGPPVWVHGDIAPGNLLMRRGALAGVIDFGLLAAGDPACDYAIAWSHFGPVARAALREAAAVEGGTWVRAQGWALWKALIVAAGAADGHDPDAALRTIAAVLEDQP